MMERLFPGKAYSFSSGFPWKGGYTNVRLIKLRLESRISALSAAGKPRSGLSGLFVQPIWSHQINGGVSDYIINKFQLHWISLAIGCKAMSCRVSRLRGFNLDHLFHGLTLDGEEQGSAPSHQQYRLSYWPVTWGVWFEQKNGEVPSFDLTLKRPIHELGGL